ncbi:M4 family metallopeptidase [Nocardioides hwasunensis]|uniref:M4 family peptidase n=1 Tax=Nocardioides hwasunensis TaxID=397258 RepID=A0ABR8MR13_9ACTN|nr:M4 family metallopeptidase [Nocardioides hwasunensis]MBD3916534.1 M4 family peptidase [Nocardioides hwasunensis]
MNSTRLASLAGIAATAVAASFLAPTTTPAGAAPTAGNPRLEAQQAASAWVKGHGTALERATADSFVRTGTFEGDGDVWSMAYERTHEGLRVVGGDFVVLANAEGQVVGSSVAQEQPVEIASTTPTLTADRATNVAQTQVDEVSDTTAPELVIWHRDTGTRLAYEVQVRGTDAGHVSWQRVWVDALTGDVLESREQIAHGTGNGNWEGTVTIPTSGSGSSYSMINANATTLRCQDAATNTTFSGSDDVWGNGSATDKETGCVDAFYSAEQERLMLASWLGRNGMDGSGGWVPIRVGLNDVNAYYDGTQVQIGHRQGSNQWIGAIDVVAHEFGHGIDDKTPGGISGGGTQEFVADTFGTATEFYANNPADPADYTIGEEVNLVGQGPIRDMSNPGNVGDPSCYSSSVPGSEVHAAAGPGDHWWYLLANGGTSKCNGATVSGVGVQNAMKIMYNAMLMKTSSSSYPKYRTWTLTAAKNLDSTCALFNSTKAAWNAVNMPAQSADPTCGGTTTPPTDPPTGGNLLANPGFESGATSWTGTSGPITNNTGRPARSGSWKLWLGGNGSSSTETVNQSVTIPSSASAATLSYWIRTDTAERGSTAYDTMRVQVVDGSTATTLRTFSNAGVSATYTQYSHNLAAYRGKTVTIRFTMTEDSSLQTSFVVDDTALNVS